MPRAAFFARLGLFVRPNFLAAADCARLRAEMAAAPTTVASMYSPEQRADVMDLERRRVDIATVSSESQEEIKARVLALKPALEGHFGVALSGCQPIEFYVYHEGHHFQPHFDRSDDPDTPELIRQRRVAISIFLNGEGDATEPNTYSGGSLDFSGAMKANEQARPFSFHLTGEEGLLVGFSTDWRHEVPPITRGVRYAIVTWLY